jgi:hypothetical protein
MPSLVLPIIRLIQSAPLERDAEPVGQPANPERPSSNVGQGVVSAVDSLSTSEQSQSKAWVN